MDCTLIPEFQDFIDLISQGRGLSDILISSFLSVRRTKGVRHSECALNGLVLGTYTVPVIYMALVSI